ncbi:MAG: fibronectin type III domain-containing protein, partial [Bacteroidota bacterium]|nr:fibronectin type III domain-containing protein [Bacteroidota bacterium]
MLGASSLLRAQDADSTELVAFRMLARSAPDSVVLRWGLDSYPAWKSAGRAGFVVERAEIRGDANNPQPFTWTRLTPTPVRPFTIEDWRMRFPPEDSLAGAAVQALHGQAVVTSGDPFGSIVELHMQQQNLMGFALLLADLRADLAAGLGLRYVDRDVQPGKGYIYRVFVATPIPDFPLDTVTAIAITKPAAPLPAIASLYAEEGEKQVVLKWDRYEHLERSYGGYMIEQSTDGGNTFFPRSDIPFMPVTPEGEDALPIVEYNIRLERNYQSVWYRIRGLTAFGELSPPGPAVLAMGRDRTAPKQPAILPYEIVNETSVQLRWELRGAPDADLDGFLIAKSVSPDGPYDPVSDLLPTGARSYVDADVQNLPAHYYVVSAVDTAGNSRMSAPILALFPDSIPPAIPSGLHAEIDSSGVLRLAWAPNTEADLQGYRVFYANDPTHEFQQLTTKITTDTVFVDTLTLKTLSEEIYYKLTALDYNFNHSPFTEALMVEKPDIV